MSWSAIAGHRAVAVSTLGITQPLAWGSTYYLPAVFADPVSAELHLPRAWFFGIFSGALLLSGMLGPLAGRLIDRRGGRDVLAATNLVFAAGLIDLGRKAGARGNLVVPTAGRAIPVRDREIQRLGRKVDCDDRSNVGHAEPIACDERRLAEPDFEIGIEIRNPLAAPFHETRDLLVIVRTGDRAPFESGNLVPDGFHHCCEAL
jgi:hypothetical protein